MSGRVRYTTYRNTPLVLTPSVSAEHTSARTQTSDDFARAGKYLGVPTGLGNGFEQRAVPRFVGMPQCELAVKQTSRRLFGFVELRIVTLFVVTPHRAMPEPLSRFGEQFTALCKPCTHARLNPPEDQRSHPCQTRSNRSAAAEATEEPDLSYGESSARIRCRASLSSIDTNRFGNAT